MSDLPQTPQTASGALSGAVPGVIPSSPVLTALGVSLALAGGAPVALDPALIPLCAVLTLGAAPTGISQNAVVPAAPPGFTVPHGTIGLPNAPGTVATSQFVDFVPSTTGPFVFQPTLNGIQYNATVTWNVFGQRYYIAITDLSNALIVCRALVSSGPRIQAVFSWARGIAAAATNTPHNVPVGTVVRLTVGLTGAAFDGSWQTLAVSSDELIYELPLNPLTTDLVNGTISFPLNLVAGFGIGRLLWHYDSQMFEFS